MSSTALLDGFERLESVARTEPAWISDARRAAWTWLQHTGLPTERDEAWRYTPLNDLVGRVYEPASAVGHCVDAAMVEELAGDHGGPLMVFVNGLFASELSDVRGDETGLHLDNIASLPDGSDPIVATPTHSLRADGFAALNQAIGSDGAVVVVDPDTCLVAPIHVVHLSMPGDEPTASQPLTLVHVGEASRLTLIETFCGRPGSSLINAVTRIDVGPGAVVDHYTVQAQAPGATHLGRTDISQSADSEVRSCSVMLGADVARQCVDIVLCGADARTRVEGLYLPKGAQHHDIVTTIEHAASGGTSRQMFKGVVDDAARGSFSGRVIVRPDTVKTDASQESRSLLLAPRAQADSRPWLEIFADDVKCTHGATVGRLDDEALFYLRSRGIASSEASAMLIGAFAAEITDAIGPATLRDRVAAVVTDDLAARMRTR